MGLSQQAERVVMIRSIEFNLVWYLLAVHMSSFTAPVFLTHCEHLAVFSVTGADATAFLQSQLTQDVSTVSPERAALAGFCTAQGRLWASMVLTLNQNAGYIGVASSDLMDSFLKRLRMFVLRSKVTIDAPADTQVYGVEIASVDLAALTDLVGVELPQETWGSQASSDGVWVKLPLTSDSSQTRWLWMASPKQFEGLSVSLGSLGSQAQVQPSFAHWQAQDIMAGLPWVEASTQDLFIAQTLNLDLIGAISFTKGCYPGQEVVARAHYRGTVKRRMHPARIQGLAMELKAGMDVFEATDAENPVGRLINVAHVDRAFDARMDGTWVLFEAPFKSLEANSLRAGSVTGPELLLQPLPYAVAPQA